MLTARDFRAQYDYEPADWVVIRGGANDMFEECGCSACEGTLERMMSADAAAREIPALLDQAVALETPVT